MIVDQDHQGRIISEHANFNLFKPSNQAEANALLPQFSDLLRGGWGGGYSGTGGALKSKLTLYD